MQGNILLAKLWALLTDRLNQELLDAIDYLQEEVRVLKQQLNKRPHLKDAQRKALAEKAKKLGKAIENYASIVTPDTLYRWHRRLVARKFDGSKKRKRTGRPTKPYEIIRLIKKCARENRSWGARTIEGAIKNLGYNVSHEYVRKVMKKYGIEPAPQRSKHSSWSEFIRQHKSAIWACDFFTKEVWTLRGLKTCHVLFFINTHTRKVILGGVTDWPTGQGCQQIAREITAFDGPMPRSQNKQYLIHDRGTYFTEAFDHVFRSAGIEPIKLPPQSPNLNAYAERFVRSIKEDCLNQLILVGQASLQRAVKNYIEFHQHERCHQGIHNLIPFPDQRSTQAKTGKGKIVRAQRIGGLLNFYYRKAA